MNYQLVAGSTKLSSLLTNKKIENLAKKQFMLSRIARHFNKLKADQATVCSHIEIDWLAV